MTTPIPFATQAYELRAVQFAAQRCVNLFPEIGPPGAKTPIALLGTPGLTTYITVGNGPIRGLITMQGFLFAVSGNELYRISVNGQTLLLGELPGIGLVKLASNGEQILILTGTSTSDGFIATTTDLTQITDEDFLGATDVAFIDGYFILSRPESNEFYISALYNGFEYDPLDFARAEGSPDNIVGVEVDHREIWLMCESTTEVWYNAGNADFPFERASGTFIERGLAGRDTIAQLDNTILWVGDDRIVYRADGYSPVRVSTHAIEEQISDAVGTSDLIAFGYSQEGHAQYVLKKPNNWTFVYDVATQLWHERCSCERTDYKVSTYVNAFSRLLAGDDRNGTIYFFDAERAGTEDDGVVVSRMAAPPLFANEEEAVLNALVVDFERGVGADSPFFFTARPDLVALSNGDRFERAHDNSVDTVTISNFRVPEDLDTETTVLLVGVVYKFSSTTAVNGVTFKGESLTAGPEATQGATFTNRIQTFYLKKPADRGDIVTSFDNANATDIVVYALLVKDVDNARSFDSATGNAGNQPSIAISVPISHKPSLVVDFFGGGISNECRATKPGHKSENVFTDSGGTSITSALGSLYEQSADSQDVGWESISGTNYNRLTQVGIAFPATDSLTRDPQVMLRYSDDAGLTWSSEKWRSLGKVGEYARRARWNRMGRFRQRVLELSISDPVQRVIMGAYAKLERGGL